MKNQRGRPPKDGKIVSFKLKNEAIQILQKEKNQTAFVENAIIAADKIFSK